MLTPRGFILLHMTAALASNTLLGDHRYCKPINLRICYRCAIWWESTLAAQNKRKSSKRRTKSRPKQQRFWPRLRAVIWRLVWRTLMGLSLLTVLLSAGYAYYIDRTISKTFEGRRWSVPAQVYAQPLELFSGLALSKSQFITELTRLGYRPDLELNSAGTYREDSRGVTAYLRGFRFIDGFRPAQILRFTFNNSGIRQITEPGSGEVVLVRMDPAKIGSFFPSHGEDRIVLTPEEVPTLLAEGLKAIEDRNFDEHRGFSVSGILRALIVNLRAGATRQGGSTLTQQLVKSYFLTNEQTLQRKLRELAMAVILELRFSKQDLLTAYVNEIFLGQNGARAIHGFGLGAQFYFNKPLNELGVAEVATLISIIRGPSYYNPFRHPERALTRRDRILDTFYSDGLINAAAHRNAKAQPLGVVSAAGRGGAYYPAFMDLVRSELSERYSNTDLRSQGLQIFTTLEPRLQENTQQAVSRTLNAIERERELPSNSLQAASVVADSQTGEVLALVGGRQGRVDGFNRALNAQRSVGSVIKPVTVLTALNQGMDLTDKVVDQAVTLPQPSGETWAPKNFDGKTHGPMPMYLALSRSLNLAMVDLGQRVGIENVQQQFTTLTDRRPNNPYPSFLLGAEAMSPLQTLELYGNFASGGFHTRPKAVIAVLDENGSALSHHTFEMRQSIQMPKVAALNRALELVMRRGTGRTSPFAQLGVAGKTGTTNDNRDSWFAGFDNSHLSVVWVGRDDNQSTGLTGSSGALRVWNAMARRNGVDPITPIPSDDLVAIEYTSGRRATARCADVVLLPVRTPQSLAIKPGCNIKPSLKQRLRSIFTNE